MREIVFDTETTGFNAQHEDPRMRDRVVEIGCVELINLERTGLEFHAYLNPERSVPEEVVRIHGLSGDFLKPQPKFTDIAEAFLAFIGDAPLVAHNAAFDQGFINAELTGCGREALAGARFVDTVTLARKRFPGASNKLDALAKRFELDRYGFDLVARKGPGGHGALVDSRILAEVYLQLKGGREQRLVFDAEAAPASEHGQAPPAHLQARRQRPAPLAPLTTAEEATAHAAFVVGLGPNALWLKLGG